MSEVIATKKGAQGTFRRITVAMDASADDRTALDAVASLAARMDAELTGLFVEDTDLLRLDEHAHVRTFSTLAARWQPLESGGVARLIRLRMASSRKAVEDAARRRQVRSRFEVRRGQVVAEVLASAEAADLLVVGWASGALPGPSAGGGAGRPGTLARAVAAAARRPVLLLKAGAVIRGPLMAAFDGSDAALKALDVAAEIAGEGGKLEVALVTSRIEDADTWQAEIRSRFRHQGLDLHFFNVPEEGADQLCLFARQRAIALVVLGIGADPLECETATRLIETIDCSVLLVR